MEAIEFTSESLSAVIKKVNVKPYIDEVQAEVARLIDSRPRSDSEWEAGLGRLQTVVREQSGKLATQLGLAGDRTMLFMLSSGIISVCWAAFAVKRSSVDPEKPFEQTIAMTELFSQIANAVAEVIEAAGAYADIYKK